MVTIALGILVTSLGALFLLRPTSLQWLIRGNRRQMERLMPLRPETEQQEQYALAIRVFELVFPALILVVGAMLLIGGLAAIL